MTALDLHVSPLGRVEGDLDVRVTIEDGVVTSAWTEAAMFRGFEIILRGKDPQAGLIVTPAHLRHLRRQPPLQVGLRAGHRVEDHHAAQRHPGPQHRAGAARRCSRSRATTTRCSPIDLTNKNYAKSSMYDEAVRRYAPYVGTSYQKGVVLSQKPVEVYAIFGGQWPHSSFMVPGGVMCAADPLRRDPLDRDPGELEGQLAGVELLGCSVDRWLENKTWEDVLAWVDENESQHNSDCGFFIRYSPGRRPGQVRQGRGQLHRHRHLLRSGAVRATRPSRAATPR